MSPRLPTFQPSDGRGSQLSALKFNGAPGSLGLGQLCPLALLPLPTRGLASGQLTQVPPPADLGQEVEGRLLPVGEGGKHRLCPDRAADGGTGWRSA